jgi:hypothetical protein
VVAVAAGTFLNSEGVLHTALGLAIKFVGAYSSHLHNAEVGYVWWPETIAETLDAQVPGASEL